MNARLFSLCPASFGSITVLVRAHQHCALTGALATLAQLENSVAGEASGFGACTSKCTAKCAYLAGDAHSLVACLLDASLALSGKRGVSARLAGMALPEVHASKLDP